MRGLATSVLLSVLLAGAAGGSAVADPGSLSLDASTVLLVIAPHPDDETLCCAGVIQRVLRSGGSASVVWITSGDGSELGSLVVERSLFVSPQKMRAYGETRMREARKAAGLLGVPASGQLFLGYPDGGVLQLLRQNRSQPYTSGYTAVAQVPYAQALFPGHAYTGQALERDLAVVLERVRPTLILAPSPLDSHSDHSAAGLLALATSASAAPGATVRYWIVHGGEGWPNPRGLLAGVPLTPAPLGARLDARPFWLTPDEEDQKLAAVKVYETQLRVMEAFLLSFVRTTELFSVRGTAATAGP